MMTAVSAKVRVDNREPVAGTLEVVTEVVDVTSLTATKPNLAWEFIDPAGHFHAWDREGKLPTLDTVSELISCLAPDECGCEGYSVARYVCAICAWDVNPAVVPDPGPHTMPGRSWWVVTARVELEMGAMVSVVISSGDTAPKFFGVARVSSVDVDGGPAGITYVSHLQGAGPLGRKR